MPGLFDPFTLRGLTLPNRIVVSPMCQYSCQDGLATMWHAVHLGSRAVGGAGLVLTEATAVTPEGRISPEDLGLWSDVHADRLAPVIAFIREQGRPAGVQLAHAGRKGSTPRPWAGTGAVAPSDGGWVPVGPGEVPFTRGYPVPEALDHAGITSVVSAFRDAAVRARVIGAEVIEVHAAHGYLLHEFLSPLSNARTDAYGGGFEGRIRLCLEVVEAVREVWPERLPLWVRISATDWTDGGWDVEQSVELARRLADRGVDLIDCSSGGNVARAAIPVTPGYQVPFAERIRREAGIPTGAVGLVTDAAQADAIVAEGRADCVLLARALLRDPYWPLHAAQTLGVAMDWPVQYLRAAPPGAVPR
ncbi:MAG TPA: NADH:flavin oxidoreductase/NADH oxidase [Vicinamibacterales bacterium]|nr:NADH:flavin oxidoreductase/NADH oxidase [Vicinamibacterales bacterium]